MADAKTRGGEGIEWLRGVVVLSAVVRITTNSRAFVRPSSLEDAFGFCNDLRIQPHCQMVEPGERHWEVFGGCVSRLKRAARA